MASSDVTVHACPLCAYVGQGARPADLARQQVERDRLEINRLQVQRDEARRECHERRFDPNLVKTIDGLRAELEQLQPVLSVVGDYDWSAIVEDGCIDDDALEKAAKALAYVEKARKETGR